VVHLCWVKPNNPKVIWQHASAVLAKTVSVSKT